jgi:hypothetical protein
MEPFWECGPSVVQEPSAGPEFPELPYLRSFVLTNVFFNLVILITNFLKPWRQLQRKKKWVSN